MTFKHLLMASALLVPSTASAAVPGWVYRSVMVASDGTFLGTCTGAGDVRSFGNSSGPYGSKSSATSIYNPSPNARYGGTFSRLSAYHPGTAEAPYLLRADSPLGQMVANSGYRASASVAGQLRTASGVARVSVSSFLTGAVHPDELRAACD
ncbi:hypothetical protein [Deinococcus maricopensis]|uniref:Uncharacterized protein n=1 Tax=Deinococcus maricopensis (strain DSM 21211 / LMG 22137 / NRRL B-23946 / LB-34) TaxID=709986 RepID=E8UBA2_DEIML|nr:hypothetical protein [Deinococcus maricopensis]ADV68341.1 hypothetical protein Deima_2711 [Deinococcus maricopensis DSM 21211]